MKMAENQAKKEQVHTVFQNISQKYDRLNNIISFEQHKVWKTCYEYYECTKRQ